MTLKSRERRTNLIANLLSKQGGAEDAGAIEEAADYEALADKASEVLDRVNGYDQITLCLAIGGPPDPVNLPERLGRPQYSRNIYTPGIPPALATYVKLRNTRIKLFQYGDALRRSFLAKAGLPLPSHYTDSVRLLMGLLAAYGGDTYALRKRGIPGALSCEMKARRQEVNALKKAIRTCIAEAQSTTVAVPWQLGHVFLLRDLAVQDFEFAPDLNRELRRIIGILQSRRWGS